MLSFTRGSELEKAFVDDDLKVGYGAATLLLERVIAFIVVHSIRSTVFFISGGIPYSIRKTSRHSSARRDIAELLFLNHEGSHSEQPKRLCVI